MKAKPKSASGVGGAQRGDEIRQRTGIDSSPQTRHKFLIIMQIMYCRQPRSENLATLAQVPQVSEAVVAAGVAVALGVRR